MSRELQKNDTLMGPGSHELKENPLGARFLRRIALICTMLLIFYTVPAKCQEHVVWSEDFEGAANDWDPDRGVWEIGVPTNPNGPKKAISGTRCAAVGLRGNYVNGAASNFIRHRFFTVPPAAQHPRLRFWHWFSIDSSGGDGAHCYQGGDYGRVQVILPNGTGEWISFDYVWSSDWTRASLSLEKYAGRSIEVAFYFYSNCAGQGPGWFIDDVQLVTGDFTFSGFDGFECGLGDWASSRGNWYVGSPTVGPTRAYRGTKCAGLAMSGTYYNGVASGLVSPPFTVPTTQNPRLRFWHWFSIDGSGGDGAHCYQGGDYGQVYAVLPDGTEEALSLAYFWNSDWTRESLSLAKYAGRRIQVEFYFYSNCSGTSSGWYIDDVQLVTSDYGLVGMETFEEGLGDWAPNRGNWQVGTPVGVTPHSGTNCAGVVLKGNYPAAISSSLRSPKFTVPADNPMVRFYHTYSIDGSGGDGGHCYQRGDYGQVYLVLPDGKELAISPEFYGSSPWTRASYPLGSTNVGKTVQVEFFFYSNCSGQSTGWFIDDVEILPAPVNRRPILESIATQIVEPGCNLNFTSTVAHADVAQILTFSLEGAYPPDFPEGAQLTKISQTDAVFSWTPSLAQCTSGPYYATIRVTDDGLPPMTHCRTVAFVPTNNAARLVLPVDPPPAGFPFIFWVKGGAPGMSYAVESTPNLRGTNTDWIHVTSFRLVAPGEFVGFSRSGMADVPGQFFRIFGRPIP